MNNFPKERFNIFCVHFSSCSGCFLEDAVHIPPILEEAKLWFRENGISDFNLRAGLVTGWRTRAKLAVRGSSQDPRIGLYKAGSHEVIDIPRCQVHHPAINRAVELLKALIRQNHLTIYEENGKKGDLRYLQFTVERASGRVHVTFVLNVSPSNPSALALWREALEKLWADKTMRWHSFSINFNTRHDNVIFGPTWELWFGDFLIWESFLGVEACFQPSSFAQANPDQFEDLLKTIDSWVPAGANVVEYYAGGGVIGLTLAAKSKSVRCCEINPLAQACFEESQKKLSPSVAEKISWACGPSAKYVEWLNDAEIVVIDPPRKGVEAKFLACLKSISHPVQLVYVSCGWHSFKNDATALIQAGWLLRKAEGHLFFPGSNHIETVALFEKIQVA